MKLGAADVGRLWRTVRWLKTEQLVGRVRFRLARPRPDMRAAPPLRLLTGDWVAPAERECSLAGAATFSFLNETHDLQAVGWDDPGLPLLWRYNLHYFDDLTANDAAHRRRVHQTLVQRWVEENPPGRGTAWAPYPTSLRIVNWVKWFVGGQQPQPAWLHSLAVQARWLSRRLEWHLLGNHLLVNAKALVMAGLFFEGAEAESWLATGLQILARELPEQVLPDGGQFERSPMYHALAVEDVLDLLNAASAFAHASLTVDSLASQLRGLGPPMLAWLRHMRHPGGGLARFNDSAEGIAPTTVELERYAAALGVNAPTPPVSGITLLQPSGYARLAQGPAVAFLDVAPIGPDYLPGHAHADTLSFELSVAGRELVVNRGTSVYGIGARRLWERGTAAHSTVQIGSHDSSEVWSGFRVGRRARPHGLQVQGRTVQAWHDGYLHLKGKHRHHRRWQMDEGSLLVDDWLEPLSQEPAVARFHLAAGLELQQSSATVWLVLEDRLERARMVVQEGDAVRSSTLHAQRFGQLVEAATLDVALRAGRATVRITWEA